jgi:acetoin utilization deacetylase AcuC-like enzyme
MLQIFTSARCQLHAPGFGFPERPERLAVILERLRSGGRALVDVESHDGAREAVTALHPESYQQRFERAVERRDGLLDSADNPLAAGTWEAAWAAVETALAAADWVAEAPGRQAFAAVRPPGHHAERQIAMGFCFFNNIAVAADYLRRRHGCDRVAIFDFDVHHGNGTQHLFEARSDVLYTSVHQFPLYPGTGAAAERGVGDGEGATLNVPLPAGTGDEGYQQAIDEQILPALRRFRPQVLLLSAGFDAWRLDPLAGMQVTEAGYAIWGERLGELADEVTEGRIIVLLEGGYDLTAMPALVEGHLAALSGEGGGQREAGAD